MSALLVDEPTASRPPSAWRIERSFGTRQLAVALLVLLLLFVTGQRVEIGRMAVLTGEGLLAAVGLRESSQVSAGLAGVARQLFPVQLSERTEVARIENFDRDRLPWLTHLELSTVHGQRLNPDTLQMEDHVTQREVLVEPLGYLWHVAAKMVETLEIALWATLLAVLLSLPLSWLSAQLHPQPRLLRDGSRAGEPDARGA